MTGVSLSWSLKKFSHKHGKYMLKWFQKTTSLALEHRAVFIFLEQQEFP